MPIDKSANVMIDYTNHAGVRAIREIIPTGLRFGSTDWHHEPQYLIDAHDVAKDDLRTFAVKGIHSWSPSDTASGRSMASYAKQLRASMERNARMSNRLKILAECVAKSDPANFTPHDLLLRVTSHIPAMIAQILKDEEPTWLK